MFLDSMVSADAKKLQKCFDSGFDVNHKIEGFLPLHFAVKHNFPLGVELLLKRGAHSLSHNVTFECSLEVSRILMILQQDVQQRNPIPISNLLRVHHIDCVYNPLHEALLLEHLEIADMLLRAISPVDLKLLWTRTFPNAFSRFERNILYSSLLDQEKHLNHDKAVALLRSHGAVDTNQSRQMRI